MLKRGESCGVAEFRSYGVAEFQSFGVTELQEVSELRSFRVTEEELPVTSCNFLGLRNSETLKLPVTR